MIYISYIGHKVLHEPITIVDNYSKAVWVYMLHDKSQVENNIFDYFTLVQRIQQVGEDSEEQQWY